MTNEEFLCAVEAELKERNLSLYKLQERIDEDIIKESTFYSLFHDRRTVRIEYIIEICRALDMSPTALIDPEGSKNNLKPVQIELLNEFEGCDEAMIRRILPIIKGLVLGEKNKQ